MRPFPSSATVSGLLALAALTLEAGEESSVRGLTGETEMVLRGRVLDQEPAPGGLWHRLLVEEALWPPGGEGQVGPALRVFAHGPGLPDAAVLEVGGEVVLGVRRLSSLPGSPPDLLLLLRDFRPDREGDRPALAAPDGLVKLEPSGEREALLSDLRALVRAARARPAGAAERLALIDVLASSRPEIRAEALRQLTRPDLEPQRAERAMLRQLFRQEIDGPADPAVLSAHLELAQRLGVQGLGALLARLVLKAPREELAHRAAAALARGGTEEDYVELQARFRGAPPGIAARILRALTLGGSDDMSPYREGLRSAVQQLREAAARELVEHPSAAAEQVLEEAASSREASLRDLAIRALAERRRVAASGGVSDEMRRLAGIIQAAARRVREEGRR